MNDKNRSKLNRAMEILTKVLHFNPENIMVTGSIALDLQGVLTNRISHDVDLILKTDDQTWHSLKLIEALCENDDNKLFNDEYFKDRNQTIFLTSKNLVLNIWRYDGEWSDIKDSETGVYVATVDHIIKAKKMYGRPKDFQDINEICRNIL